MNTVANELKHEIVLTSPLCCNRISKAYDSSIVLNGIDLSIPPGAVLGLIGRNGAGKSTLIRILLGLLMPDRGESFVLGEPSLKMTDASKTRLGYVPQQPDALAWMRVKDMLEFIGSFYPKWDMEYAKTSLARWMIPGEKVISKLSPGERQRVALIRALASNPELLVLDEPAAALDPVARRDLLREIALRAGESGTTVLFSTHIVSDLERVASHVAFLHKSKLLLNAPMDDLKETHARLLLPSASAQQLYGPLPGEIARHRRSDGSVSIVLSRHANCNWPEATQWQGARLDMLGLEDLFVEVTE
jgi:ABC-2 type transport system ATP-binding protein